MSCSHAVRGVNLKVIRDATRKHRLELTSCRSCCDDADQKSDLSVCLQCANVFCFSDDDSATVKESHLHSHMMRTDLSDDHCIAVDVSRFQATCFTCQLLIEPNDRILQSIQCLKNVAKRSGQKSSDDRTLEELSVSDVMMKSSPTVNVRKPCGLVNLGNTCYFNVILQALASCQPLTALLQSSSSQQESGTGHRLNCLILDDDNSTEVELGDLGCVTSVFVDIIRTMIYSSDSVSSQVVNPQRLHNCIGSECQMFAELDQHDAHELLRHLIDLIKNEEVVRSRKAVLAHYMAPSQRPVDLSATTKAEIKRQTRITNHTLVDRIFGGWTVSSVICDSCNLLSVVYEQFLDLSLSLVSGQSANNGLSSSESPSGRQRMSKKQIRSMKRRTMRAKAADSVDSLAAAVETLTVTSGDGGQSPDLGSLDSDSDVSVGGDTDAPSVAPTADDVRRRLKSLPDKSASAVEQLLSHYTSAEQLTELSRWSCERCRTGKATKQLMIVQPPAVLTVHVKRFAMANLHNIRGRSTRGAAGLAKDGRHISFPTRLDLSPFCSTMHLHRPPILYQLFAVIEHSGSLYSGHYTCYVASDDGQRHEMTSFMNDLHSMPVDSNVLTTTTQSATNSTDDNTKRRRWYHISDASVKMVSEERVLECQAFMLFYERVA